MRMHLPALAVIALGCFSGHADAQAQCPAFIRLLNEAVEAQKPFRGLMLGSCGAYVRSAEAWRAVVEYADENREMCNISDQTLSAVEHSRRSAINDRNNVCGGRPLRAFPAEIIQR
jgi:hypothetical protein